MDTAGSASFLKNNERVRSQLNSSIKKKREKNTLSDLYTANFVCAYKYKQKSFKN